MTTAKKDLKTGQMFNLNLGLLSIQFAWSLAIANMSGIYSLFGAKASELGYLWLAPSIIGLITPPLIGYFSDRTNSLYGRRLPYIFAGSILTAICLFAMPNAQSLIVAAVLLCIFSITMNSALQPYRPLVADVVSAKLHTKLYAIQAGLIGTGATLASIAPWLFLHIFHQHHISNTVPSEIKLAFYSGAIALIATTIWTALTCRKYLPVTELLIKSKNVGSFWIKKKLLEFVNIPKIMRQVSYVQFFTWLGVFCFIVYLTPAIEQAIFHVSPTAHLIHNASYNKLIEKSIIMTGLACAVYMLASVTFAYLIPIISRYHSRKNIHIAALIIGAISLISMRYIHQEGLLLLFMIGFGISWASFNSIPFAMIASSLPKDKLGYSMGVFNFSICLPQIIVSAFAGYLLKTLLHNNAIDLIVLSGISFIIAALLVIPIKDHEMLHS